MANITLKTRVDTQELDEAIEETIEKANRLVELLREASSLASSLAEKQTAPSVDNKELFESFKNEMDKEITRCLQARNQSSQPFR